MTRDYVRCFTHTPFWAPMYVIAKKKVSKRKYECFFYIFVKMLEKFNKNISRLRAHASF